MAEIEITPPPTIPPEDSKMPADIPDDRAELILSSLAETDETLTAEVAANEAALGHTLGSISNYKFQEPDPLEAASAEAILTIAQG